METPQLDLPQLLIIRPPTFPNFFKDLLRDKYHLLDPVESGLPTHQFLKIHGHSVRALVSVGPGPVTAEIIGYLPVLALVVASGAGVDHIDLAECHRRGIVVTNVGDSFSEDVADYAVGLLIDVLRGMSTSDRFVRAGLWPVKGNFPLGSKVGARRVGIVGLGSIGSLTAKRLEAFGCSIAYNSRTKKPSVHYPYYSSVRELAANCDVLIVCCALTNETYHIINKDVMKALGKQGVIINVGRGCLIDEKELVQFLVQGEIGGAGLDVFEDEPNVPKELYGLDNVVLSPHKAVATPESLALARQMVLDNLQAFFSDKPVLTPVKV
ncbi:D-isomer specific 2-hydroxyacid dehydrogenase, NAD-binding domain [Dillenia turbinata]|uniref:D-isomer specific 2-hydroxyacid dehydrogenase, NAD-binding domain n=1 Tax=Dillenia turbinata TaxID=194707 RepID=A0AAN8W822_9MAGN